MRGQALLQELMDSKNGTADKALWLIAQGADVNTRDIHGNSCLAWAARRGFADVAAALVKKDAPVNDRDIHNWSPLLWAAANGHPKVAEVLINHGADVNAQNDNRDTPLILATLLDKRNERLALAKMLLLAGADARIEGAQSQTALESAYDTSDSDMILLITPYLEKYSPATSPKALKAATTLQKPLKPLKTPRFKPKP